MEQTNISLIPQIILSLIKLPLIVIRVLAKLIIRLFKISLEMAYIWRFLGDGNYFSNFGKVVHWIVTWQLASLSTWERTWEVYATSTYKSWKMLLNLFFINVYACVNDATRDGCGTCWDELKSWNWVVVLSPLKLRSQL